MDLHLRGVDGGLGLAAGNPNDLDPVVEAACRECYGLMYYVV